MKVNLKCNYCDVSQKQKPTKAIRQNEIGVVLCRQKSQRGTFANQNANNAPFTMISHLLMYTMAFAM
jgi:hypothetical protein